MDVTFLSMSPHIKELQKLAKQEGFSNIESMEYIESKDNEDGSIYRLVVNDRGIKQTKFKFEKTI